MVGDLAKLWLKVGEDEMMTTEMGQRQWEEWTVLTEMHKRIKE